MKGKLAVAPYEQVLPSATLMKSSTYRHCWLPVCEVALTGPGSASNRPHNAPYTGGVSAMESGVALRNPLKINSLQILLRCCRPVKRPHISSGTATPVAMVLHVKQVQSEKRVPMKRGNADNDWNAREV